MNSFDYLGTDLEAMLCADNYNQWIFDALQPYLGDKIAEVGAGQGNFTRLLFEQHHGEVHCFEPSRNMFPLLEEQFRDSDRVKLDNHFFVGKDHVGAFDTMVYVNVLEHIEHDLDELKGAWQALQPGGHLLIYVPALMALFSESDRQMGHFRRYRRSGLRQLVEAAGFNTLTCRYYDSVGALGWWVNCVLLKRGLNKNAVFVYDRFVVPWLRRLESLVAPPLGKNVLLIARK